MKPRALMAKGAWLPLLCALCAPLLISAPALAGVPGEEKLLSAIRDDSAYKVRMAALSLLSKKLKSAGGRISNEAMDTLGGALIKDDSHLVRGLAAFSLGSVGDERARPSLQKALKDSNAFVRAQAEQALGELDKRAGTRPGNSSSGPLVLVVQFEQMPGVQVPDGLARRLSATLKQEAEQRTSGRFRVADGGRGKGYVFRGSVAKYEVDRLGGKTQVSISVKVTIATWPDNNLRHVFSSSAKASSSASTDQAIAKFELKVLEAAAREAAKNAVNEIMK